MLSERDRDRLVHEIDLEKITNQRNQVVEDLKAAERAFNDVHRKYERTKEVISDFKRNEDALKVAAADMEAKKRKAEDRYELLKSHAESKLAEYDAINAYHICIYRSFPITIISIYLI